ncbi:glycosyltransferase family 4 protein [Methylococcaceae bacterium WWC4]|nr:glycosyltransferase family 4 protein [Methylococcaceae bacterium WWC4]
MLLFFLVVCLSAGLTGLIRLYALRNRVLDIPNQRSSHTTPTPRGGGLAMVISFAAASAWLYLDGRLPADAALALAAALPVAAIGFLDDHAEVSARLRLAVHLLSAGTAVWLLNGLPAVPIPAPLDGLLGGLIWQAGSLGYALALLGLVWSLNLFNFMDGTDGIAASEALFVSAALAGLLHYIHPGLAATALTLAAASAGFLIWNRPKAKIFMGDVGSGFIGLALGLLIVLATREAPALLYCGVILYGLFIVDASYTLARRALGGQRWYAAHCSHTYQHAAKRHGHANVLLACWAINLLWLLPIAFWVFSRPAYALAAIALAYTPLILLARHYQAGQPEFQP